MTRYIATILLIGALSSTFAQDTIKSNEYAVCDTIQVIFLVTHHDGNYNNGAAGWIKGFVVRKDSEDVAYLDRKKKTLSEKYLIWDYSEVITNTNNHEPNEEAR